jgi:hypothetical protein
MSYSSEIAELLAKQITKLSTFNRHQLAGQIANLDFWLAEVKHCFSVIHDYEKRFVRMKDAQEKYVNKHATVEFDLEDPCRDPHPVSGPIRVPARELKDARTNLKNSIYRFLKRCVDEKMIDQTQISEYCDELEISA